LDIYINFENKNDIDFEDNYHNCDNLKNENYYENNKNTEYDYKIEHIDNFENNHSHDYNKNEENNNLNVDNNNLKFTTTINEIFEPVELINELNGTLLEKNIDQLSDDSITYTINNKNIYGISSIYSNLIKLINFKYTYNEIIKKLKKMILKTNYLKINPLLEKNYLNNIKQENINKIFNEIPKKYKPFFISNFLNSNNKRL
jgi:hypothetical protein